MKFKIAIIGSDNSITSLKDLNGNMVIINAKDLEQAKKLISSKYYCESKGIDLNKYAFKKCVIIHINEKKGK